MIVHVMAGFREVCLVTAALPLATLLCCFVGALMFQADEVHETHCRVFNIIPSISAITGVSPQRYFLAHLDSAAHWAALPDRGRLSQSVLRRAEQAASGRYRR